MKEILVAVMVPDWYEFSEPYLLVTAANINRWSSRIVESAVAQEPVAWLDLGKLSSAIGGMTYATSFRVTEKQTPLYTQSAAALGVPDDVARDAARYRWLRDESQWREDAVPICMIWERTGDHQEQLSDEEMDEAIDVALAATARHNKSINKED